MPNRMLAVALGLPTMAQARAGLSRIREAADCVELRLDLFEEPFDVDVLLRERGALAVVATLRPPDQGGRCSLPAAERLAVLVRAAELGADYVDLEFDAASPYAQAAVRAAGAKVIVSRHDLSLTPVLAEEWWRQLADLGADVVKVVGTAREVRDCIAMFRALAIADRPTIAIAMADAGLPTRVLALRSEECLLTYASLDAGAGTAPGQITLEDMRSVYRVERLGPRTCAFGLLGPHVERERLAEYNAWFARDEVDGVAVPFVATAEGAATVDAFRELPVHGWHIHGGELQREVLRVLDALSPSAAIQGKANAVVRASDGSLTGHWVESPREQYELWRSAA